VQISLTKAAEPAAKIMTEYIEYPLNEKINFSEMTMRGDESDSPKCNTYHL
jgi:hypothetical protein